MLTQKEIDIIEKHSIHIGDLILKMSKGKQSFGSFVKNKNCEINDIFPYFEQSFWAIPMNKEQTIVFENNNINLSKLNNYDISVVFIHKFKKYNDVKINIKNNLVYIIVESKTKEDLKDMLFYVWTNLMKNNKYI